MASNFAEELVVNESKFNKNKRGKNIINLLNFWKQILHNMV